MKKLILTLGACLVFIGGAVSCSITEEMAAANLMTGRSLRVPVFLGCKATAEDEIQFTFSVPVKLTSVSFTPDVSVASIEDGGTAKVKFAEKLAPGMLLTADILAEDEKKNTLNVIVPVRSRNNRMPQMVINEIRTENSKPRCEFIEFVMKSGGNLGGMRVFIFGNSNAAKKTVYEFSPVEVRQGEYVVLNLRTPEETCKDEYGTNLAESGGENASPSSRDFWVPGNNKLIHKTSIVYVLDQDDNVLASVMMSDTQDDLWKRAELTEAAEFLCGKDIWKSPEGTPCPPAKAVNTNGTTATRTICRDERKPNSNTADDWYVTVTSGHTPGKPNNTGRYNP